ncbi:fucose isomerase [Enterococcus mundtii]|uniref:RbsD/FucU family protein n=1 Tax=Enterococcus mundtii TaxID=53346 RepID=UPI00102033DA|nr:RbsD/FucU domain-containing protein [Enterococcus mundtii]MZZ58841.1 fucose isomerase [Enterococcus mundtii]MZZ63201.1 fucose isomerase [Enterococcus mundtii]MZZ68801.1 fucose isomerase [Enterococcus mundtii]MZZ97652.1 fucose isomerase [Enterococcus mundtii]NAA00443.1 fucose isomerase [Enterococcus mundtii]
MLKNIPKNLSPELVKVLMEMGHGDEIVLADGNYPAASNAKKLIRCDGLAMPQLLKSILELFPLDQYVEQPVALMAVAEGDENKTAIWEEYKALIDQGVSIGTIERQAFYERGKQAYAIVATGEEAIYANILLKKGVVK